MRTNTRYRHITPTDVDRFIQLCIDIVVDFTHYPITIAEDAMSTWDCSCFNPDFAIYCEVPKHIFFDLINMEWKYAMQNSCIPVGSVYTGAHAVDAGSGSNQIVDPRTLTLHLTNEDNTSRFVHFKQCNRFFKYSFKVGDLTQVTLNDGRDYDCQLYAVYLCPDTGIALPYATSVPHSAIYKNNETCAETYIQNDCIDDNNAHTDHVAGYVIGQNDHCNFSMVPSEATEPYVIIYYTARYNIYDSSGNALFQQPTFDGKPIQVICPPHPLFVEYGPLATEYSDSVQELLKLRDPPSPMLESLRHEQFVDYQSDCNGRALLLYYIVNPSEESPHSSDTIYGAYRTHNQTPIKDIRDSCGKLLDIDDPCDGYGTHIAHKDHFNIDHHPYNHQYADTINNDHAFLPARYYRLDLILNNSNAQMKCPRLHYPISRFTVTDGYDPSGNTTNDTITYPIPFAYEVPNELGLGQVQGNNIHLGVRLVQLISEYLFDGCSYVELENFIKLESDSRELVDSLVTALSSHIQRSSELRNSIIAQLIKRYGRRYFDEYSNLQLGNWGEMKHVLAKINEMFIMFTVSIMCNIRDPLLENVERFAVRQIPIVFRLHE